jgi:hypothetical protein
MSDELACIYLVLSVKKRVTRSAHTIGLNGLSANPCAGAAYKQKLNRFGTIVSQGNCNLLIFRGKMTEIMRIFTFSGGEMPALKSREIKFLVENEMVC